MTQNWFIEAWLKNISIFFFFWFSIPFLILPIYICPGEEDSLLQQSGQITGSGTVPNLVQVYRIRYIQSHNASDRPKVFQISNWQIKEKFQILMKGFTRILF